MNQDIDTAHPHKINMLMALTGLALSRDADQFAQPMFELVSRFRPKSPRVDSFEGWFCMRRGDLLGATRHLTAAVEALGSESGSARTLLAMVLCAQGDPSWLVQAQIVIDEGWDPNGVFLMKSLRGDTDAKPAAAKAQAEVVADHPGVPPATDRVDPPLVASAPAEAVPSVNANRDRRMVFLRG